MAHPSWWAHQPSGIAHGYAPGYGFSPSGGGYHPGYSCGPAGGCGPQGGGGPGGGGGGGHHDDDGGGWSFGVRRPLRFLAHKLDLDDAQVAAFAKILDELKTERAQAEVDRRRTVAAFADALAEATFDQARADEGGQLRVQSAERLRGAVVSALAKIHAVLGDDQRARLAYLIRTGTLTI